MLGTTIKDAYEKGLLKEGTQIRFRGVDGIVGCIEDDGRHFGIDMFLYFNDLGLNGSRPQKHTPEDKGYAFSWVIDPRHSTESIIIEEEEEEEEESTTCKFCFHPNSLNCSNLSPDGWLCTLPKGHTGMHVACCSDEHKIAVWE